MTYNEIYKAVYSGEGQSVLDKIEATQRAAWQIIRFLDSLGGFDHWWDAIEGRTKDEIFCGLCDALTKTDDLLVARYNALWRTHMDCTKRMAQYEKEIARLERMCRIVNICD